MGTTIGPILTLGFSQTISDQAVALSPGYALGLGLPFLALAVLVDRALGSVSGRRKYLQTFQWINGLFLILLGALLLTSQVASSPSGRSGMGSS